MPTGTTTNAKNQQDRYEPHQLKDAKAIPAPKTSVGPNRYDIGQQRRAGQPRVVLSIAIGSINKTLRYQIPLGIRQQQRINTELCDNPFLSYLAPPQNIFAETLL